MTKTDDLIQRYHLEKLPIELQAEITAVANGEEMSYELYEALFNSPLAEEMPYGTAKARTGDPIDWLTNRIQEEMECHTSQ